MFLQGVLSQEGNSCGDRADVGVELLVEGILVSGNLESPSYCSQEIILRLTRHIEDDI